MKEIKWSYFLDENDDDEMENNDKDDNNNNDKGISALGLDRDMGFSGGHQGDQGHKPYDDDDEEEEEEDDKAEDNNKDDNNNKDDTNYKGISALGLDTDLRFSQGHQGQQGR